MLRKSVPLKIQDLNNQQTLYKKNDNNLTYSNNQNRSSCLFIDEWKKNSVRSKTSIERNSYLTNGTISSKNKMSELLRSTSSTLFNKNEISNKSYQEKKTEPWHYNSVSLYPWIDRSKKIRKVNSKVRKSFNFLIFITLIPYLRSP